MPSEFVTIVTGLGRCGSSMLMQMLVSGGMESSGGSHPMWEDERSNGLPATRDWLYECGGKVVKILNPHHFRPPMNIKAKIIWLDRDTNAQTDSWRKWGLATQAFGPKKRMLSRGEIRHLVRERRKKGKLYMRKVGGLGFLSLKFEDVLTLPKLAARQMNEFLQLDLDTELMAAVVYPRGPECLKGFLETVNRWPGDLARINPEVVK